MPGRTTEMGLRRKMGELIAHCYCIISVGGKGPVCYRLLAGSEGDGSLDLAEYYLQYSFLKCWL